MEVNIRYKALRNNRQRIYLDYYPPLPINGGTRREFLDLFIYSDVEMETEHYETSGGKKAIRYNVVKDKHGQPKRVRLSAIQKQHNETTDDIAKSIQAQRILQIQKEDYGFLTQDKEADFLAYFSKIAAEKLEKKGDNKFTSALKHLRDYCGGACTAQAVTADFCEGFKEYLLTTKPKAATKTKLSDGAAFAYYAVFRQVVALAANPKKGNLLKDNPCKDIDNLSMPRAKHRKYVTPDELAALIKTPCPHDELKRACLLSAMTGLRHSDLHKLKWGEIVTDSNEHTIIVYTPEKTDTAETLPIPSEAVKLLGTRGAPEQRVFTTINYSSWLNGVLNSWAKDAGITKRITFHTFRHSYAVLLLMAGNDIYTVSKMLAHKNINTTQIYAQIVDETKKVAANSLSSFLGNPLNNLI